MGRIILSIETNSSKTLFDDTRLFANLLIENDKNDKKETKSKDL